MIASKAIHPCAKESTNGEMWLSTSENITGPWLSMQRVATHATTGISCYNPLQLPFFEEDGGAKIHFACTVTSSCASSATRRNTAALIWVSGPGLRCRDTQIRIQQRRLRDRHSAASGHPDLLGLLLGWQTSIRKRWR